MELKVALWACPCLGVSTSTCAPCSCSVPTSCSRSCPCPRASCSPRARRAPAANVTWLAARRWAAWEHRPVQRRLAAVRPQSRELYLCALPLHVRPVGSVVKGSAQPLVRGCAREGDARSGRIGLAFVAHARSKHTRDPELLGRRTVRRPGARTCTAGTTGECRGEERRQRARAGHWRSLISQRPRGLWAHNHLDFTRSWSHSGLLVQNST